MAGSPSAEQLFKLAEPYRNKYGDYLREVAESAGRRPEGARQSTL